MNMFYGFGYPFFYDPTFIILLPAILLAMYAQMKIQAAYARYSRVTSLRRMTGAEVARALLDREGLYDVGVEMMSGHLTDHYDPRKRVVRLSPEVYRGISLAAMGIAAHETGHAAQHHYGYVLLGLRNSLFPVANIGSSLAFPFILLGLFMGSPYLLQIGIWGFALAVLFQIVTLPVEYNASSRAVAMLEAGGYIYPEEKNGVRAVLSAAALTYVAATVSALLQLLRLLLISGMFGRRDD